ncbi:hypothetical protein D3C71_1559870 [compost metagenome]
MTAVLPLLRQRLVAAAVDQFGDWQLGGFEAGGDDQYVQLDLLPTAQEHAGLVDALDARGLQIHVGLHQRRVVVVRDQDALAADRVVRRELLAQRLVGHLGLQMIDRHAADHLDERRHLAALREA